MKGLLLFYGNAFGGLSRQAWLLSLMVFINRSGAIVLPFLAVYVSEVLQFSLTQTGLILSLYGLGSVSSSLLGGWLTDRFGQFNVQFLCQVVGGILYLLFTDVQQFEYLAIGVFLLALVNDCIRPSNAAAVTLYTTPETVTRAFSLNRMAVNLGFVVGPAIGGVLAANSFKWVFIANGVSSILAGLFFFVFFYRNRGNVLQERGEEPSSFVPAQSPYKDYPFLLFVLLCSCFATVFYQLFSTLPLYYRQAYLLSEKSIGLFMSFNGLLILLTEMFVVYLLVKYVRRSVAVVAGVLLLGLSFLIFNLTQHVSVLIASLVLFSFSEILTMPFISTIAAERSKNQNRGAYMGLITLMYALPLVLSPFLGTRIVSQYGFNTLWWISGALAGFTAIGLYFVIRQMERSKSSENSVLSSAPALETFDAEVQPQKLTT